MSAGVVNQPTEEQIESVRQRTVCWERADLVERMAALELALARACNGWENDGLPFAPDPDEAIAMLRELLPDGAGA